MPFPAERPRRLRRTPALRRLVGETRLSPADLVHPLFLREGIDAPVAIASLPGHRQETVESAAGTVAGALQLGVSAVLLFGVPVRKDASGSEAWNEQGIVQTALRSLRGQFGADCVLIADCCLDEYTDHGHCGVLREDGSVDNDATLELYARTAVSQARAGADVIAPSGMMDGQVGAIRTALDGAGFAEPHPRLQRQVRLGDLRPFRDAADCAPRSGDRRGYQMAPATPARLSRGGPRRRGGRRHGHGQAGAHLPRRDPAGA